MTNVYEHNPGDHEDPQTGSTWIIGGVGTIILIIIVFGLTALLYQAAGERVTTEVINKDYREAENLKASQVAELERSGRITRDEPTGKVTVDMIPITEAMKLVVNEAAAAKNQSSR